MRKFLASHFVFIVILLLASFFRLWHIASVPPSASLDEASIGYNAYSVLKTGVDEFGQFPIISQRGYDDYRRSTYLFLTIPFIAVFGLTAWAVRMPAVLLSILTVCSTYFVVKLLFNKGSPLAKPTALLTMFLLAISPWHIYISRLGHESNACLSFLVFGILCFLQSLKNKRASFLFLSVIFFTLSTISYYSGQAFIPLLIIGLISLFAKNILEIISLHKKSIIAFILLAVCLIPIGWSIFSPLALIRFQGTSTFKPEAHQEEFTKLVLLHNKAVKNRNILGIVIYNRRLFPIRVLFEGYISHFQPQWLFANSSNESFKAPHTGLLYPWELPFILIGIFALLFKEDIGKKCKMLIFLWFFLGPLPAAIATQTPHAMRSYNFLPTWQIFTALGLLFVLSYLKKFKFIGISIFVLLILYSISTFYNDYFFNFPKMQSKSFQYAFSKEIPYIVANQSKYKKIVFSNKDNLFQSYMLFLYNVKYDPKKYHSEGGTKSGGYNETHSFGKYEFRPITWNVEKKKDTLFVANPGEIPEENILSEEKYLDGKTGVIVRN